MNITKTPINQQGFLMTVGGRTYVAVPAEIFADLLEKAFNRRGAKNEEVIAGSSVHEAAATLRLFRENKLEEFYKALDEVLGNLDDWPYRQMEATEDVGLAEDIAAKFASGEEEHIPETIAKRLIAGDETPVRIWREYRGLSQAELARQSGVSQPMISNMDRGNNIGSPKTLRKLANVLNVTVDDLLP